VTGSDPLRDDAGRFRRPTAVELFARQAPVQGGATGDLSWLDRALAPSRRRAHAVHGPATDPAPAPVPEPQPEPAPSGPQIPAGPMGRPPTGDLLRDALRRGRHRHG
jgi:hypothetical protein